MTSEPAAPVAARLHQPLDVVIVTHNGRRFVQPCLDSLVAEATRIPLNILVVDNQSTDGALDVLRHYPVEVIAAGGNLGFGRAANIGLRRTSGDLVLLLNPDTVVPPGALAACVQALLDRPAAGMLGCKLVRDDGSLDHACKRQIPTPVSALAFFARRLGRRGRVPASSYTAVHLDDDEEGVVGAINGAFMLVRRQAIDDVGLFDEAYWMYGEDLDWCLRFAQGGWPVVYWPGATVVHAKGGISGARRSLRVNLAFHRSMWIFFRKHQARQYPAPLTALVWLGVWLKFGSSVAHNAPSLAALRWRGRRGHARRTPLPDA